VYVYPGLDARVYARGGEIRQRHPDLRVKLAAVLRDLESDPFFNHT